MENNNIVITEEQIAAAKAIYEKKIDSKNRSRGIYRVRADASDCMTRAR